MSSSYLVLFSLILSFITISKSELKKGPVHFLDDSNFEHLTQASTGGTTGNWLLAFGSSPCLACQQMQEGLEYIAGSLKYSLSVARVDCGIAKDTCHRFGVKVLPTVFFMMPNKGVYYHYKGRLLPIDLVELVASKYKDIDPTAIPPPITQWDKLILGLEKFPSVIPRVYQQNKLLYVLTYIAGGLILLLILLCICMPNKSSPKVTKTTGVQIKKEKNDKKQKKEDEKVEKKEKRKKEEKVEEIVEQQEEYETYEEETVEEEEKQVETVQELKKSKNKQNKSKEQPKVEEGKKDKKKKKVKNEKQEQQGEIIMEEEEEIVVQEEPVEEEQSFTEIRRRKKRAQKQKN